MQFASHVEPSGLVTENEIISLDNFIFSEFANIVGNYILWWHQTSWDAMSITRKREIYVGNLADHNFFASNNLISQRYLTSQHLVYGSHWQDPSDLWKDRTWVIEYIIPTKGSACNTTLHHMQRFLNFLFKIRKPLDFLRGHPTVETFCN